MTMPTLQVSVWLADLSDLYGQQPVLCALDLFDGYGTVLCALDLFDGYGTVDPKRQLGSTSHKRRVDGGEVTTALALVDEADTRPAAPRHHLQRCLPVPSRGLGI